MSAAEPTPDDDRPGAKTPEVSGTALGPAAVRDTPLVKPSFPVIEDEDEPRADPWIGQILSNVYEIERKIGEGGMGAVYMARHIHLKKAYAVKVLVDSVATRGNAVDRLQQEATAAANIDHENIVDVVNFDRTEGGAVFIVMEMLEGEALADAIGRGPIGAARALAITYQICSALHATHEHGIVHRDLKPENVFLNERRGGTIVKVLDFGISKIKSAEAEGVRMTKTGQLVGTPLYMSPEQSRGESEIDRRVDIYAMGVMLFEMLTGAPPFDGKNYFELLWKHGNEPAPTMAEVNPNVPVPQAIEAVVAKALAKDKDERFPTMAALADALMAAAPDVPAPQPMRSLPPERRTGEPLAAGGIALAPTEADLSPAEARAVSAASTVDVPRSDEIVDATAVTPKRSNGKLTVMVAFGVGLLVAVSVTSLALHGSDEPDDAQAALTTGAAPDDEGAADPARRGDDQAGIAAADEPDPGEAPPADPPPGVDPPRAVHVTLTSSPPGAEARLDDAVLGTTPISIDLEPTTEPIEVEFTRPGYLPERASFVVAEGVSVPAVELRRRPRRSRDSPQGGANSVVKGTL